MGILIGISSMQGLITLQMYNKRKPYIVAFCCRMFWQAIIITAESVCYISGTNLPVTIEVGLDMLIHPLFVLEATCLINQDTNALSWKSRWTQAFIVALPIFAYIGYCAATGTTDLTLPLACYILGFIISLFSMVYLKQAKFHKLLTTTDINEKQDVVWIKYVILLMTLSTILYMSYSFLPDPIMYYGPTFVFICLHGYFIRRQAPINMTKMKESMLHVEQKKALEELKTATDQFNKRTTMDMSIKAFRVSHTGFEQRLRQMAQAKLTQRDIYLCILIYEGKRISEIAQELAISSASVEVARHRLRTKLNLDKGANMNNTLHEIIDAQQQ